MKKYIMNSLGAVREIKQTTLPKYEELANWLETGEIEEIDLIESAQYLRIQAKQIEMLEQECAALRKQIDELLD
jgi:hypothetical protein